MSNIVNPTGSEIREDESSTTQNSESRPLESYSDQSAYVLLGAPGVGKTEAFKQLADMENGCFVSARDFLTFESNPEWRNRTLYIDGLDEVRAGKKDGRMPLDRIRNKLDAMGNPRFRLSCRDGYWFEKNDRKNLKTVSPDGSVVVLRLDPLSDDDVRKVLQDVCPNCDAEEFISTAKGYGVDHLLTNPQSLIMIASAVNRGEDWPESRTEVFGMACRNLLKEHNSDHRIVRTISLTDIEQAAGRLCALQLISGAYGFSLLGDGCDNISIDISQVSGNLEDLQHALSTKLFERDAHDRLVAVHQQISEFLAAKFLAARIADGLPVERILALITGFDGVVVSQLRGLSAWLAALSPPNRRAIISRDALGTVLYGDVKNFTKEEKQLIVEGLKPYARNVSHPEVWIDRNSRLGEIATPDMLDHFESVLTGSNRDDEKHLLASIILRIIYSAPSLPEYVGLIRKVLQDRIWKEKIRFMALATYKCQIANLEAPESYWKNLPGDIDCGVISETYNEHMHSKLREHDEHVAKHERSLPDNKLTRHSQWQDFVRQESESIRKNNCPPMLLHNLALAYFGEYVDVEGDSPLQRLRFVLGSEEHLIDHILQNFQVSLKRRNTPTPDEIMKLDAEDRSHLLAVPILAGLEILSQSTVGWEESLNEDEIRLALTIQFTDPFGTHTFRKPIWYERLLRTHPTLTESTLTVFARHRIKCGKNLWAGMYEESFFADYAAALHKMPLVLLENFPARCTEIQLSDLGFLLRVAILHCNGNDLSKLIQTRISLRSMNIGQRVYWLTAGFFISPNEYKGKFLDIVQSNERRISHLSSFVLRSPQSSELIERLETSVLKTLISVLGSVQKTVTFTELDLDIMPAWAGIRAYVNRLAHISSADSTQALLDLLTDERLVACHPVITRAIHDQSAFRREAEFRYYKLAQVEEVIDNRDPANAADLAVLTVQIIKKLTEEIRNDNASSWRKFWNVDSYNRPLNPKPENACRDCLVQDLNHHLKSFNVYIDSQPEGIYSNDKQADIRVSYGKFNVPIEIKISCSREVRSGLRKQLIESYTRDPGASGYGIYLVLWFGNSKDCRPIAGPGGVPKNADDLRDDLMGTLSTGEKRKISISIIDVSEPVRM